MDGSKELDGLGPVLKEIGLDGPYRCLIQWVAELFVSLAQF